MALCASRQPPLFLFVHSDLNFWVISFVICVDVSLFVLCLCFWYLCFVLCKCLFAATCCVHGDSWESRSRWILTLLQRFPRPGKRYISLIKWNYSAEYHLLSLTNELSN